MAACFKRLTNGRFQGHVASQHLHGFLPTIEAVLNGLDLGGHHGQHLHVDAVELIETAPESWKTTYQWNPVEHLMEVLSYFAPILFGSSFNHQLRLSCLRETAEDHPHGAEVQAIAAVGHHATDGQTLGQVLETAPRQLWLKRLWMVWKGKMFVLKNMFFLDSLEKYWKYVFVWKKSWKCESYSYVLPIFDVSIPTMASSHPPAACAVLDRLRLAGARRTGRGTPHVEGQRRGQSHDLTDPRTDRTVTLWLKKLRVRFGVHPPSF